MSRTNKTKPFWVKMKQGHLATSEIHDHRDGPCDLPAEVELDEWKRKNHCRHEFRYTGIHTCCCALCHGDGGWDVRPAKRQRLNSQAAQRDWRDEYDMRIPADNYYYD